MKTIVTLTLNPAIDGSCDAPRVHPTHKIRTTNTRYDPGGGGINVARVVQRLGGKVRAIYLAGGATGGVLDSLLDRDGIARNRLAIAGHTRISQAVHELETGLEYRFVPDGPEVSEAEWQGCLAAMREVDCDYLVLSGSLPRGVPVDSYARLIAELRERGAAIILDTSGPALRRTLEGGGIFLVKPSRGELEQFAGRKLEDDPALLEAAREIVRSGLAKHIAVTLGHQGALLVSSEHELRLTALAVEVRSAVGAGDSFLGAATFALASGQTIAQAMQLGLAAGTAAVMSPGTGLCHPEDIAALLREVRPQPGA
jgi:6-phosphofructokinase 2